MREIAGKVAWITGAGSGIGEAAALALAGAGMHVVLSGRRMEALGAVAQKIEAAGGRAMIEVLDVADRDAVYRVAERIAERFDRLDMLVNNAGINIPKRNWGDVTLDGWEEIVNINLNGAFYCIAAALPVAAEGATPSFAHAIARTAASRFVGSSVCDGRWHPYDTSTGAYAVDSLHRVLHHLLVREKCRATRGPLPTDAKPIARLQDKHVRADAFESVGEALAWEEPLSTVGVFALQEDVDAVKLQCRAKFRKIELRCLTRV